MTAARAAAVVVATPTIAMCVERRILFRFLSVT
jgi:hypothetical protein